MPYAVSGLGNVTLLSPVPGLVATMLATLIQFEKPQPCVPRQQKVAGVLAWRAERRLRADKCEVPSQCVT